jgi:glycosyltransferase involved in cell wall biosynthesis
MTEAPAPSLTGQTIALIGNTSWYLYKFRRNTIRALRDRGADVVCIAPKDSSSAALTEELGARYVHYHLDLNGSNPLREAMTLAGLTMILARYRPDFVFNFNLKPNIYSGIACRLLRLSYANNVTGLGLTISSGTLFANLTGLLLTISNKGAARIFVQNSDDLSFLQEKEWLGRTTVTQIPGSGVDLELFSAQQPPPSPLTFLMIARLQADKGVREFISAARQVRHQRPEVRFLLVGSNKHANRTAISDEELDLWRNEGIVEIAGYSSEVRPWLAQCHALVLPSHGGEGIPRVILEAAASARPAIVSDVAGCRQAVLDGRTGYICPPKDSDALAKAMERFASLGEVERAAMAKAARAIAEERFSEEIVIDAYLDCLDSRTTPSSKRR